MLVNFAESQKLHLLNTFYMKKKTTRWTWISLNADTKNEIDFILSTEKNIIQDVSVLNCFTTSSDQRMLKSKIKINTKPERSERFRQREQIDRKCLCTKKMKCENEPIDDSAEINNNNKNHANHNRLTGKHGPWSSEKNK